MDVSLSSAAQMSVDRAYGCRSTLISQAYSAHVHAFVDTAFVVMRWVKYAANIEDGKILRCGKISRK